MPASWIVLALVASCGDAAPPARDAGVPDALPAMCATDVDCDDGRFCTGVERCAPDATDADERGCAPAHEPACLPTQTCVEAEARCVSTCAVEPDADGDGHDAIECGGDDCDDAHDTRHPGNAEVCDAEGRDEDCDLLTLGDDADGDGHASSACCNLQDAGFLRCGRDCADARPRVNPDAAEVCNTIDDNCNGSTDEGVQELYYRDDDRDGFGLAGDAMLACDVPAGYAASPGDCDDTSAARSPATSETCDGIDNNCDGRVDEEGLRTYYRDSDGDLVGTSLDAMATTSCILPPGYVATPGDCEDADPEIRPGIDDICDGVDGNCSLAGALAGGPDATEDADGDGHAPPGSGCVPTGGFPKDDCDDAERRAYGGADELCDGIDDDCDAVIDEGLDETDWCGSNARCEAGACRVTRELAVSAQSARACAIGAGGTVSCGLVGAGPFAPVPGISGAVEVALGYELGCARLASGDVACWNGGPVGPGGAGITDAVEIATSSYGLCARLESGAVRCWGGGGDSTPISEGAARIAMSLDGSLCARREAGDVVCFQGADLVRTPFTDARDIVRGWRHVCVRRASGVVACWGENVDGQLGDGSTIDSATPVAVSGIIDAVEIATGPYHTCARTAGGRVSCWGHNEEGAIGDGSLGTPALAPVESSIGPAELLALGHHHTCARRDGGELGCLVVGGTLVSDAAQITADGDRACARLRSGEVWCWGADAVAEGVDRAVATLVPGIADAIDVATDDRVSCAARASGRVTCWGVGYGTAPADVAGVTGAIDVGRRQCAVRRDATGGQTLRCWSPGAAATEVSLPVTPAEYDAGPRHRCIRATSGEVYCWGENNFCQCRNEGFCYIWGGCPSFAPCSVFAPMASGMSGTALALGDEHTIVLASDGTIALRGRGTGFGGGDGYATRDPYVYPGVTGVLGIAAGPHATYAVGTGGTLTLPTWAPRPPLVPDAVQVAAGTRMVCVLRAGSAVECNGGGQSFWRMVLP